MAARAFATDNRLRDLNNASRPRPHTRDLTDNNRPAFTVTILTSNTPTHSVAQLAAEIVSRGVIATMRVRRTPPAGVISALVSAASHDMHTGVLDPTWCTVKSEDRARSLLGDMKMWYVQPVRISLTPESALELARETMRQRQASELSLTSAALGYSEAIPPLCVYDLSHTDLVLTGNEQVYTFLPSPILSSSYARLGSRNVGQDTRG